MTDVTPGSIAVGDTGKNLDTTVVETTEGDVHREVVVLADPANPDARVNVVRSKEDTEQYSTLVHTDETTAEVLGDILIEMKLLNARFEEAFRTSILKGDVQ